MSLQPTSDLHSLLEPNEILEQEFEYARETALQANSDRTQVVNLYLILVGATGSLIVGLPALAPGESAHSPAMLAALFFLIGGVGFFTVLKLIRLRQAWHDSVLAMNRIKDFYLEYYPELKGAFRWRTATIPPPGAIGTITFNLVVLVGLIDSLAVGGGMSFLSRPLWAAAASALGFFVAQEWVYFHLLKR